MDLKLDSNSMVILDLDDTLYSEIDYLKSAFREIAAKTDMLNSAEIYGIMMEWYSNKEDVFSNLSNAYSSLQKDELIRLYRNHMPAIRLREGVNDFLNRLQLLNIPLALITDGRSISQRNKLKALGIENRFDNIFISEETGREKQTGFPFQLVEQYYPQKNKITIGDNINKDFYWPEKLGWLTIGINQDDHIHANHSGEGSCFPKYYINSFTELNILYE